MTEQKTIWHDKEDFMFYKAVPMKMDNKHIIVHLVVDDVDYWDMILCGEKELNNEAVQYIKKWCYLNDLLEQSNKVERLESEVSRYKATKNPDHDMWVAAGININKWKNNNNIKNLETILGKLLMLADTYFDHLESQYGLGQRITPITQEEILEPMREIRAKITQALEKEEK